MTKVLAPTFRRPSNTALAPNTMFDRVFNDFLNRSSLSGVEAGGVHLPPTDILEGERHVEMRMDLPGIAKEDVDITVEGDTLTVSAERNAPIADGMRFTLLERPQNHFNRTFRLQKSLDLQAIEARFENGVLLLRIPKQGNALPRQIEIE